MSFPSWPPVVAIRGTSNSGKTTLIERLVPRLIARELRVAVVKHCSHHIEVDTPGKDSDRIFKSGADVLAAGPDEAILRLRADHLSPEEAVRRFGDDYDVVLVEGYRDIPVPQVNAGETLDAAEALVWDEIVRAHAALAVSAAVLVGGRSTRMGSPKSMMLLDGQPVVERIVSAAKSVAEEVVLVGAAEVPDSLSSCTRLPDAPDIEGPMAGILSAMRCRPKSRWLVLACDLALISPEAVTWLLAQVRPGLDVVAPKRRGGTGCEPLFAVYEPSSRTHLERAAERREWSLRRVIEGARAFSPEVPDDLARAWTNVNTPEDLDRAERS